MIKILKNKGHNLNERHIYRNSLYFRNALVISNFTDICLKISPNFKELESFSKLIKIYFYSKKSLIEKLNVVNIEFILIKKLTNKEDLNETGRSIKY